MLHTLCSHVAAAQPTQQHVMGWARRRAHTPTCSTLCSQCVSRCSACSCRNGCSFFLTTTILSLMQPHKHGVQCHNTQTACRHTPPPQQPQHVNVVSSERRSCRASGLVSTAAPTNGNSCWRRSSGQAPTQCGCVCGPLRCRMHFAVRAVG